MSTNTVIGNLVDAPTLRFTAAGQAVANFTVAENNRRKNASGEWEDSDPSYFDIVAWGTLGENVSELAKGTRVMVFGRMEQRSWEDKEGNKRYSMEVTADEVGPSLRWATAEVTKKAADGNGQSRTPARSGSTRRSSGGGY